MHNNIVIHIGGPKASELYKSFISPIIGNSFDSSIISIATDAKCQEQDGKILITLGTPLPPPMKIPSTWKDAIDELPLCDGVFSFIYWDQAADKVVICTDFLGFQPIYWKREREGIFFGSHTKIFCDDYDPAGWGAFLAFGHNLGNRTLTKGVERVPPACILTIDIATRNTECRKYWSLGKTPGNVSLDDVYSALDESMDKAISSAQFGQTLLMSGGFDSRLIACLLKKKRQPVKATIVSHYDENFDADAIFAKAMCHRLKMAYEVKVPDNSFFSSNNYLDYLFASDSEIPSLYLFIAQVLQYVPHTTVWDGLLPGGTLKARSGDFKRYFSKQGHSHDTETWNAAKIVFKKAIAEEMWQAFQGTWAEEISTYSNDHEGATRFFLEHRMRNRVSPNPFKVFSQIAQVLTPGMTRSYIDHAMAVPSEKKVNHKLYRELFSKYFPEATTVPIAHGSTIEHNGLSPASRFLSLASSVHNYFKRRPRIMRYLTKYSSVRTFQPSHFLTSPSLIIDADPALNPDFLNALHRSKQVPPECYHLLFYWRVWRWLHNGQFNERLRAS